MCDVAEKDLYWLAGLLEGEASFHLISNRGGKQIYPVIRLKMCDRDVVEKAAGLLGCPRDPLVVPPRNAKHKTQYIANVLGSRAVPWLHRLRPLMGQRRQKQIDSVLAGMTPINLNHKHCKKLDQEKVDEIRALWQARAMTQVEMATLYGVSKFTINELLNGHSWTSRKHPTWAAQ